MESEVLIVLHYLFFNFTVKFLKLCHELHIPLFVSFFPVITQIFIECHTVLVPAQSPKKKKITIEICVSEIHRCTSRPQKRICLVLYRIRKTFNGLLISC